MSQQETQAFRIKDAIPFSNLSKGCWSFKYTQPRHLISPVAITSVCLRSAAWKYPTLPSTTQIWRITSLPGQIYNNQRYCGMCYDSVHQARDANAIGCSTFTQLHSPPQNGTLLVELTRHLQQTNTAPRLKVDVTRPVQIAFADNTKITRLSTSSYTTGLTTPTGKALLTAGRKWTTIGWRTFASATSETSLKLR